MATSSRGGKRADEVRKRRGKAGIGAGSRRRQRKVARNPSLPPMMVRAGKIGYVRPTGKKSKNRRRFDIALGVPGAELHLPAIPTIRIGWRFLSGFLVVGILGLLYTLWNSSTYQVPFASVTGIQRLTTQEVNTVLNVAGKSIFSVEPVRLIEGLQEAFPELYNITIHVQFPSNVVVTVEERQPVLAWQQDGLTLWVDENGVAFPPRGEAAVPVIVDALDSPETVPPEEEGTRIFLSPDLIPAILEVGESAPPETHLLYDARHGLGWMDPQGWQVFLGLDSQDMETKLQVYRVLEARLQEGGITPALVSVEHVDAPYYRLDR